MSSATELERTLPVRGFYRAPASAVAASPPIDGPMHANAAKLIRFCAIVASAVITTVLAVVGLGIALFV